MASNTLSSAELFRKDGAKEGSAGDVRIKGVSNFIVCTCPLRKQTTEQLLFGITM